MPQLCPKKECTGCSACASICPKKAIVMQEDKLGFLYPYIDQQSCVDCLQCEKVCNALTHDTGFYPPFSLNAFQAEKEVCLESSSGGFFYSFSKRVVEMGWSVCGVVFSDHFQKVRFSVAQSVDELSAMRHSKYVAVEMDDIYDKVYRLLSNSRKVVFFGLPCHVAGLKAFLCRKRVDSSHLITVDLLCHGSGAPFIWRSALADFCQSRGKSVNDLEQVVFRSKPEIGGKRLLLLLPPATEFLIESKGFPYYYAFENRLIMRESCYGCKYQTIERTGDITIGDMIPIDSNGYGRSVVLVNSQNALTLLSELNLSLEPITEAERAALQKRVESKHLAVVPPYRRKLARLKDVDYKKLSKTLFNRNYIPLKYKIKRIFRKLFNKK